ncbi:MAG: transaldolase, partial [Planctomycetota bacterium]
PDTVNTLPPKTRYAFIEKGDAELAFCSAPDYSELDALAALGVDVRAVCARLQADGITAFQRSFEEVLGVLEARRKKFAEGR